MAKNTTRSIGVDKTLADQLQINEREIAYRKSLLGFNDEDVEKLLSCRDIVVRDIDTIVDTFYANQLEVTEISLLIGDAETLQRLRMSMRRYVLELFEGYYDAEYVNKRLRIGKVHNRIGVSPKLYISAITLLEVVVDAHLKLSMPEGDEDGSREGLRMALHKLLMFDVQLVFDTYITSLVAEVETAKGELELYAEGLEATVRERTRQLEELSTRDQLTGLFNKRAFLDSLRREVSMAERTREPIALAYIDLNGFKTLNDEQGHQVGDQILHLVGETFLKVVREVDVACRYGGDEFCVIMPRTGTAEARIAAGRIVEAFEALDTKGVSFSMGIAVSKSDTPPDMEAFIRMADRLMYQAKELAHEEGGYHFIIEGIE